MLDERAKILLKALVERYIADGQPVGSRTLSRASGLELSAATIRNVMADLEELGLIVSPHTSAGRVPTARGYRLFVDTMLTARALGLDSFGELGAEARDQLQPDQPQRVISNAAQMLSSLSQFVGGVTAPRKATVVRHIEFLGLGERRLLVILVSPADGAGLLQRHGLAASHGRPLRAKDPAHALARWLQPRRGRQHLHRWRKPGRAF